LPRDTYLERSEMIETTRSSEGKEPEDMPKLPLILIGAMALAVSACGPDTATRATTGAAAGALVAGPIGAVAGAAIGGSGAVHIR
jgi:osmotically inducible lipoprotein OsmB